MSELFYSDVVIQSNSKLKMEYLRTDAILLKIFKEQKTVARFLDVVIGFLIRNTAVGLKCSREKLQLQQFISNAASCCDSDQHFTSLCVDRINTNDGALPATSEIETETEIAKVEINAATLQLRKATSFPVDGHVLSEVIASTPSSRSLRFLITDTVGLPVKSGNPVSCISIHQPSQRKLQPNNKFRAILPNVNGSNMQTKNPKITCMNAEKKTKRLYKCSECSDTFISFRQLKAHEMLHTSHSDGGVSICVYCCSLYANAETLEKHITEYHANGKFLCVPCAKVYKSRGQLLKHVHSSLHNAKSLLYYCSLCPRSGKSLVEFTSRTALQQHYQELHLLMPINQDEDDIEIEMNEEFLDEFLLHNTNENSFHFSECWDALDLNLPDMLHLPNSNAKSHSGTIDIFENTEYTFKCPNCYEGFMKQKQLLQHIAHKHGLQVLICNKCDLSFKDYTQWILHKRTHSTQFNGKGKCTLRENQCEICDKSFRSNAALNYHVKTHSRVLLQPPHKCPYCGKCFHTDINFKQHLRIVHSQIKRHTCELCDKQFATLDHLRKHVLSQHQNERKHICHVCAKRFTQLCHLKQHLAIHTTGKTLQCNQCKTMFWRKVDLERHMLNKHA